MPLNLFYTMVQKSQKWPKTQIKGGGGPALTRYLDPVAKLQDSEPLTGPEFDSTSDWTGAKSRVQQTVM